MYSSTCFCYILMRKHKSQSASIQAVARQLLKAREIIMVKRNKRSLYITPAELRKDDVVQSDTLSNREESKNNYENPELNVSSEPPFKKEADHVA